MALGDFNNDGIMDLAWRRTISASGIFSSR
jgi:hypothetical protein